MTRIEWIEHCQQVLRGSPEITPDEISAHNSAVAEVMFQDELKRRETQTDLFSRG